MSTLKIQFTVTVLIVGKYIFQHAVEQRGGLSNKPSRT